MDIALGISTVIFTAALVVITGFYALQTRRMVTEMHNARGAGIRPNVSVHLKHLGSGAAFVVLENTGLGPAMDVDATLTYHPNGPEHHWKTSVMPIGEQAQFFMRDLVQDYETVVLHGSCRDALGERIDIAGEIELQEFWDLSTQTQLLLEDDPAAKTAAEIEKIRHTLERLVSSAERPQRGQNRQRPAESSSPPETTPQTTPVVIQRARRAAGRKNL